MYKIITRVFIGAWIVAILCLSLYSGFSQHADNFCMLKKTTFSGRKGSVAMWLQRFGSVSTFLCIVWPVCVFSSNCIQTYAKGDQQTNDKSKKNTINKIGFYLFDFIFASFVLDGIFILIYVPDECRHGHTVDNDSYCYVAMLVILVADIVTLIFFGFILSPSDTLALEPPYTPIPEAHQNMGQQHNTTPVTPPNIGPRYDCVSVEQTHIHTDMMSSQYNKHTHGLLNLAV